MYLVIALKYLALYLLFINIVSVIICLTDKLKARTGSWRVSEKTLFTLSVAGGSVGMYVTMCLIRHKTKHKRFMIGIPIIIFVQTVILLWLLHIVA